jgi:hypothetical protein
MEMRFHALAIARHGWRRPHGRCQRDNRRAARRHETIPPMRALGPQAWTEARCSHVSPVVTMNLASWRFSGVSYPQDHRRGAPISARRCCMVPVQRQDASMPEHGSMPRLVTGVTRTGSPDSGHATAHLSAVRRKHTKKAFSLSVAPFGVRLILCLRWQPRSGRDIPSAQGLPLPSVSISLMRSPITALPGPAGCRGTSPARTGTMTSSAPASAAAASTSATARECRRCCQTCHNRNAEGQCDDALHGKILQMRVSVRPDHH